MTGQKERGDQAEREALRILSDLLGAGWHRPKRAGELDDLGDVWHQPDPLLGPTTIAQVSRVEHWEDAGQRAKEKAKACTKQQTRAGAAHGVTLLRVKGPQGIAWRAILTGEQHGRLCECGCAWALDSPARWSDSLTITLAPDAGHEWWRTRSGLVVTTVHDWATSWRETT